MTNSTAIASNEPEDPTVRVLAPGGFVVLLDGRSVCSAGERPYEFRTMHAASYAAWVCYPGCAERAEVYARNVPAEAGAQARIRIRF